ncbi:helix-turn-helix transcriptional regulator [Ruthenibacterium lactatiformans]|nr:helix-turn-helix transcriptional regulator [Ruthenibacterium lactatiformans]
MNFKQHRVSNNLTQEQVAQDVGVQRTTVAMWESGKSRPRAELLPKLAKLFGCSGRTACRWRRTMLTAGSGPKAQSIRKHTARPRAQALRAKSLGR